MTLRLRVWLCALMAVACGMLWVGINLIFALRAHDWVGVRQGSLWIGVGTVLVLIIMSFKSFVLPPTSWTPPSPRAGANLRFGLVALAVWFPLLLGALAALGHSPQKVLSVLLPPYTQLKLIGLLAFIGLVYAGLCVAFVVRKAARDLPAAYREGKRKRAAARRGLPG
jgi:hypothetical protein